LPRNPKEGIIYGCIIASISSLLIGGFNVYDNMGFTPATFGDFLMTFIVIWPVMFVIAFLLASAVVEKTARKIISRYLSPNDSTNAYICFNIVICALMMSAILTFVGGLVGQSIGFMVNGATIDVIGLTENWPLIWPRNFCIAFWVEMLIAQPVARFVMVRMHRADTNAGMTEIADVN